MEANTAFAGADDAGIELICRGMLAQIAQRFDAVRTRDPLAAWELPSGAFLVVRAGDNSIECGWLGDCAGLLNHAGQIERFGAAPDKHSENARAARLADHGLGLKSRPAPILDSLRQSRMASGRHVLGVDPEAADYLGKAVIPCAAGDELLLMTDGFAALVDVYDDITPEALMAALTDQGLDGLATRLRAIEAEDADCGRYPRFKKSDDATAIWLRIVT
jgi:hypothetical protein